MSDTDAQGGSEAPTFDVLALPDEVRRALKELDYTHPTPVQCAAFAPALEGKDLVVQARTGTGKTCAFGLPLVSGRLKTEDRFVQALVLTPTRELALQVKREVEAIAKHTELSVVAVYGGAPMGKQIDELKGGGQLVIGTPGRVLDHLKRGTLSPDAIKSFVLDECDEMLSMGFLPQISEIWGHLPKVHQTLLFSATVPKQVTRIAETRLKSPEFITLSGDQVGALEIEHYVFISHGNKSQELLQIIEVENPESAIVFCNTKDQTKHVAKVLKDAGFEADWLNADLNQSERERVMTATREGKLRFLVCTDVAARGIDISHLTHVINFDFPESQEQYVHRTGRTGRAGRMGTAFSLVSPGAIGDLYYLRLRYKIHPVERHLPTQQELKTRAEADVIGSLALKFPPIAPNHTDISLARRLLSHEQSESIVAGLLREYLGEEEQAQQQASTARRKRSPRPVPAAAEPSRDGETGGGEEKPKRERRQRRSPRSDTAKATDRRDNGEDSNRASAKPSPRGGRRRTRHEEDGFAYEVSDMDPAPPAADAQVEETPQAEKAMAEDGAAKGSASEPRERPRRRANNSRRRSTESQTSSHKSSDDASSAAPASNTDAAETDPRPRDSDEELDGEYVSLYVSVGRRDGLKSESILEVLADAGINADATGTIAIKQRHCFVNVRPEQQERAVEKLNGATICGREAAAELARPRAH